MAYQIALAGNPNCGKTTLFNRLTGSEQYVGNWPGVTVEKKQGSVLGKKELIITDLPGIYALSPFTMEEKIAYDYLRQNDADLILNIVDGSSMERNLYLTMQLLELQKPMILAINMIDEVEKEGGSVSITLLSKELGIPVIGISAKSGRHVETLLAVIQRECERKRIPPKPPYDPEIREALEKVSAALGKNADFKDAAAVLDGSEKPKVALTTEKQEQIRMLATRLSEKYVLGDRETLMAHFRYRCIERLTEKYVKKGRDSERISRSDQIDAVLTNRFLAFPFFFLAMFLLFSFTFGLPGEMLKGCFEWMIGQLSQLFRQFLLRFDAPAWSYRFLEEGVFGSLGRILTFFPQIFLLFLFLSVLEDTGYMARAAFIMDGILRRIGLSGRSFVPMLIGFGCTTSAVLSARTMENEKDRSQTILMMPFMSCTAKLPIYSLFAGLFFKGREGLVVCSLYLLGMIVGIFYGLLLKKSVYRGENPSFLLELPPYRFPSLQTTFHHTWEKARGFLIKAGTILFSAGVMIWILQNVDLSFHPVTDTSKSIFALCGRLLTPFFSLLGFGEWQLSVSLLAGLIAKEAVVTSLSVLYAKVGLETALLSCMTPACALSFLVFTLLYMPCISAVVSMRRELGNWKTTVWVMLFQTALAYLLAFFTYQLASVFFI